MEMYSYFHVGVCLLRVKCIAGLRSRFLFSWCHDWKLSLMLQMCTFKVALAVNKREKKKSSLSPGLVAVGPQSWQEALSGSSPLGWIEKAKTQ